ncbi:endolytic transglycosylase MltG [Endozoicomonas ascidiicola]|uniref:endolytic transglycosylase MltG n=1 Tax=Endozoicomonas ascidiicola TaxID=1698521 RepID=UPI00082D7CD7|nr:endolytic transglycosylase MltG [Endozoicomonas ascidiicola]
MLKKLLLLVAVALLLAMMAAGAGWYGMSWYSQQKVLSTADSEFVVERGDSLGRVVRRLTNDQVIKYPGLFELLARVRGVATDIYAGEYLIAPDISNGELLTMLVQGDVHYYNVTLVEGFTLKELLADLNQQPKLSNPVQLNELATVISGSIEGALKGGHLEGQFYADTYSFESGSSVASILQRANKKLNAVLQKEWQARAEGVPYKTPYEALIMASIIEKETGVPSERPDIAGVFVRRLNKGMRLQTDPTVIYGMGDRYQGGLSRRHLREATDYNTYVIRGLPLTPIATVGREAIQAALNPSDGSALYFVARGDGTHQFSNTLVEHNRAVRKYQISERRKDYRSSVQELTQDTTDQ